MPLLRDLSTVLATEAKFLAFLPVKPDLPRMMPWYLGLGITCSWLAGVGRYWDNPRAELWQHLGLGSVAYVLVLAFFLWLIILPLRPRNWSYLGVLTFIGMTAPPGILYAIPVERLVSLDAAQTINVWFLATVALWRVALLLKHLSRAADLGIFVTLVAGLLPLALIVSTLAILNLEHVVFNIMAGIAEDQRSPNDAAFMALVTLTFLSYSAAPFLLIAYLAAVWHRWRPRPAATPAAESTPSQGEDP